MRLVAHIEVASMYEDVDHVVVLPSSYLVQSVVIFDKLSSGFMGQSEY